MTLLSQNGRICSAALTILLLAIAWTYACESGSPSRPEGMVEGSWTYGIADFEVPDGRVCELAGLNLDLDQEGSTFSGTATSGTWSCIGADGTTTEPADIHTVREGRIDGTSVSFQLLGDDFINDGVLMGDVMEGTVLINVDEPEPAESSFTAVRSGS